MASKGHKSKLDHETRSKRQKVLEAPNEPPRPKTHWDHLLEEMAWLAGEFEQERRWKLSKAKYFAQRAQKNVLEQPIRGERKLKEEEQRMKKIALNIARDVKKFWIKIEKLVHYKYQLELEQKKKKVLDKQLDFLLGQTERYSTMLAENLVDQPSSSNAKIANAMTIQYCLEKQVCKQSPDMIQNQSSGEEDRDNPSSVSNHDHMENDHKNQSNVVQPDNMDIDDDYENRSDDESDDEHTLEEDEARITESERAAELAALHAEADLPIEEILKSYPRKTFREESEESHDAAAHAYTRDQVKDYSSNHVNGFKYDDESPLSNSNDSSYSNIDNSHHANADITQNHIEDNDYVVSDEEGKDDEATLSEEEELARNENLDPPDEVNLLQKESEMPIEELIAKYRKDGYAVDVDSSESELPSSKSDDCPVQEHQDAENEMVEPVVNGPGKVSTPSDDQEFMKMADEGDSGNTLSNAAETARSAQPTGNTFLTTKIRTKFPFLLKHSLREYQHIGLDWLVTMYEKRLNGILADEMGLGKTIMTIALLAHLACEKGIWGPHLIVVPTSVMLNWETEFLKWCPAFKILTYFGTAKERKHKRQGWLKPNYFHVCITTYRLVIQDAKVFKRKKWKYLILDEAHLIKNWKSQRWQTLLNFNSKRRILLTGTPLQNDLMELWSLMHFLMPHVFQSHQEFKDWFCNPISGMVEGQEMVNREVIDRLHNVLRPFILRRLKKDVEKQLPKKHEHVVFCRLSRRQRNLYEDFISSSETQATLAGGNFFAMISVIMQLRKVCNHPDLFEGRAIVSPLDMAGLDLRLCSLVCGVLDVGPFCGVDLKGMNFLFTQHEFEMSSWEAEEVAVISATDVIFSTLSFNPTDWNRKSRCNNIFEEFQKVLLAERQRELRERAASIMWWNRLRSQKKPVYGANLRKLLLIKHPVGSILEKKEDPSLYMGYSSRIADLVFSPIDRFQKGLDLIELFMFAIPAARAPPPLCWCSKKGSAAFHHPQYEKCSKLLSPLLMLIRPAVVRRQVYFPDRRLIQFDCGKLQELSVLLRHLKSGGHRALIFTQMTKMLDILEEFINLYGYTYLRLDGSTLPEERQTLMQRFNTNRKIFLFILSTRSGGVGINLVGADTVIFYDSDWNPAMDNQAQDRCHRIGQTREVHIYRLISESTIEENILRKANQKRALDDLVIQSGAYNTEFFKKLNPMDLFAGPSLLQQKPPQGSSSSAEVGIELSTADVEAAIRQVEDEADYMALKKLEQEEAVDNQEFTEDVVARLEDEGLVNEEDVGPLEKLSQESTVDRDKEVVMAGEKALALITLDEDIDMLGDVKQIAAAAAAAATSGNSTSFENQLRPIDRYAMRFLDLWDPVVDKSSVEYQVNADCEWELDQIERQRENLEAEFDEDEEPCIFDSWDADFANRAYREHLESLSQQQLKEQLEWVTQEAMELENTNYASGLSSKPRLRKKQKKKKLKSLKKRPSPSEQLQDNTCEELSADTMVIDLHENITPEESYSDMAIDFPLRKRFKLDLLSPKEDTASNESLWKSIVPKVKTLNGGIVINCILEKKVMLIRSERWKSKVNYCLKECSPDPWSSAEDAILSSAVHQYGTQWALVSDVLFGTPGGELYRGRYRHPMHCCERFREIVLNHIFQQTDSAKVEKSSSGPAKGVLRVTEDQVQNLLDVVSEMPETELLIQKHFVAVLSSVWRSKSRGGKNCWDGGTSLLLMWKNRNAAANWRPTCVLVKEALQGVTSEPWPEPYATPTFCPQAIPDELEVIASFHHDPNSSGEEPFPSTVNFCISEQESLPATSTPEYLKVENSLRLSEKIYRGAFEAYMEGEGLLWASLAFPTSGSRNRHGSRSSNRPSKSTPKIHRAMELLESSLNPFASKHMTLLPELSSSLQHFAGLPDIPDDPLEEVEPRQLPEDPDPSFFWGLEDLGSLPDFADIG